MWAKKLPREKGLYWFYGYLFQSKKEKELVIVQVYKISNGYAYTYSGSFISEKDLDGYFQKIALPKLPENEE